MAGRQSTAVVRRRGGRGLYKPGADGRQKSAAKSKTLPEYLDEEQMNALLRVVQDIRTRLAMAIQWRAGLRISEVAALTPADINLGSRPPELKVRQGKGSRDRIVPIHSELAGILSHAIYTRPKDSTPLFGVTRQTLDAWYRTAIEDAVKIGALPEGKHVTTHTFRHSAARHWLHSGVPINVVSKWLGHSGIGTTMRYLELISDPGGFMERVP